MRDSNELPPFDPELITRYLSAQATPDEVAAVTAWSAGHDERARLLQQWSAAWTATEPGDVSLTDHDRFMAQLRQRIHEAAPAAALGAVPQTVPMSSRSHAAAHSATRGTAPTARTWSVIAATIAVAAIAVVIGVRRAANQTAEMVPARHYATGAGQRATITLDDGTTAMLAPNTTLLVRGHDLALAGEAFFTVRHHAGTPWIVRTGAIHTRVLGTAFDVRRYAGDGATRVIVTEGKVSTGARMTAPVVAGMIAYATDSTVRSSVSADNETLTSWTRGRLVFHNAPVSEVLSAVSEWYGVSIRVSDPAIARQLLTAELDVQRSRSEFIAALEVVLDVQVTAVGDTLTVTPRRAQTFRPAPERGGSKTPFTPRTEVGR